MAAFDMRSISPLVPLDARSREPEAVDDAHLETRRLFGALRGMERVERWSGSARILWSPVRELWVSMPTRPLRVLDVAAGPGTTALAFWRRAVRAGCKVAVDGCERHPGSVELARRAARGAGAPLRFQRVDAAREPLPGGYDVLLASLYLHRLGHEEAVGLLRRMADAAGSLLVVHDLLRSAAGLRLARLVARGLQAPPLVRRDVERAVRASFTLDEVRQLAERAGLRGARIEGVRPYRWVLTWRPPAPEVPDKRLPIVERSRGDRRAAWPSVARCPGERLPA